jgi:hypothetical protein
LGQKRCFIAIFGQKHQNIFEVIKNLIGGGIFLKGKL